MIIQHPDTPAHEAACAMEANRVGMVIVQDRRHVVGVVTDRDLALRVIARGLDPKQVRLADVMTREPATLPVGASEESILELMILRHVRRIPLTEGGRAAGVVTFDDLVLSGVMPSSVLASAIRAQLGETAPLKEAGATRPASPARAGSPLDVREARHAARAAQTMHQALERARALTGLESDERALTALEVVVGNIARRVTPERALHVLSQLPSELRERLADLPAGPDRRITREMLQAELARRLEVVPSHAAEIARRIGKLLGELVSAGEIEKVRSNLPEGMRALFDGEQVQRTT